MPILYNQRISPKEKGKSRKLYSGKLVKQVSSIGEAAEELRKTRQETGYMKEQTLVAKENGKVKESKTLGGQGEVYGMTGRGAGGKQKKPRRK